MDVAILDLHQSTCDQAAATFHRNLPAVRVVGVAADVTKAESLDAAVARVEAAFPGKRIGAVFANAVRITTIESDSLRRVSPSRTQQQHGPAFVNLLFLFVLGWV